MREAPIALWRDTNDPAVVWAFKESDGSASPLADAYELTVSWLGLDTPMIRTSPDTLSLDAAAGTVTWPFTTEDSNAIPVRFGVRYELRGMFGDRRRLVAGGAVRVGSWLP